MVDLEKAGPGFYHKSSNVDVYLLLQYELCCQTATEAFACSVCFLQYCRICVMTCDKCKDNKVIFYLAEDSTTATKKEKISIL